MTSARGHTSHGYNFFFLFFFGGGGSSSFHDVMRRPRVVAHAVPVGLHVCAEERNTMRCPKV